MHIALDLIDRFCVGGLSAVEKRVDDSFKACVDEDESPTVNRCWALFEELYIPATGELDTSKLNVIEGLRQRDGGVHTYRCKWSDDADPEDWFECYFVNTDGENIEGTANYQPPLEGADSESGFTPLALPFMSLTHENKRLFAIWHRSTTGFDKEFGRWHEPNAGPRESGEWYHGTNLQVCLDYEPPDDCDDWTEFGLEW